VVALVVLVSSAARLAGQGVLSEFTYDNLRLSGVQIDVGSLASRDLRGALTGGLRVDAGYLAPHVRMLVGITYARSEFSQRAVNRFNSRLLALVNDPDSNSTIDVGRIFLADVTTDLDLQYVFNDGRPFTAAFGVGVGVHFRNGSGQAINGTFVEDALDGVAPALNGTFALGVDLTPAWRLTAELRGSVLSDFSTASGRVGFMYRFPAGRAPR
jgi:hypothetical protein